MAVADTPSHEWWVEGWAAPYLYTDWGAPTGMYLEPSHGEMFMTDSRKQRVVVFDSNGYERYRFTRTDSDRFDDNARVGEPHDIHVT
jgi:DNA-binding beta-propeller fold protein YncE